MHSLFWSRHTAQVHSPNPVQQTPGDSVLHCVLPSCRLAQCQCQCAVPDLPDPELEPTAPTGTMNQAQQHTQPGGFL